MPGSGQWKMQTLFEPDSCWYCNNYSYCLFFWNEEIGIFNEKNSIGIDKLNKLKLVDSRFFTNREGFGYLNRNLTKGDYQIHFKKYSKGFDVFDFTVKMYGHRNIKILDDE